MTADPADQPEVAAAGTPPAPQRPRFGTIVWGAVLLGFAAFMLVSTVYPDQNNPTVWLLGTVTGLGVILVAAGVVAASRRIH